VNDGTIGAALRPISEGLEHDGYAVGVELAEGRLSIRVTAGRDACVDCLVPKSLMTELVMQALGDAGLHIPSDRLHLSYPNEGD
jgi:hypothetical protein